jgi:hypothetical protein
MSDPSALLESVLASMNQEGGRIDATRILLALSVALGVSLWVLLVYLTRAPRPTRNFAVSLVFVALVTALVILPISSNVMLSLGMVGALSIVRFRAAVKDPLDVVFMFWAIAVGIASGAGFYGVSALGSAIVGLAVLVVGALPGLQQEPKLLVLHFAPEAEAAVTTLLPKHRVRSRLQDRGGVELVLELGRMPEGALLGRLLAVEGVRDVQLVEVMAEG